MDKGKEERIKRFINDKAMSDAVYEVLLNTFLTPCNPKEVQFLAASRISIDMLREAWKAFVKYDDNEIKTQKNVGQIAL